jgi:hypothetical protein
MILEIILKFYFPLILFFRESKTDSSNWFQSDDFLRPYDVGYVYQVISGAKCPARNCLWWSPYFAVSSVPIIVYDDALICNVQFDQNCLWWRSPYFAVCSVPRIVYDEALILQCPVWPELFMMMTPLFCSVQFDQNCLWWRSPYIAVFSVPIIVYDEALILKCAVWPELFMMKKPLFCIVQFDQNCLWRRSPYFAVCPGTIISHGHEPTYPLPGHSLSYRVKVSEKPTSGFPVN